MTDLSPKPEHKFTFGLWTVGNIGRDPFGGPTREPKTPAELVYLLDEVGAYGVAQAWEAGKLFHIHLNDQYPGGYD